MAENFMLLVYRTLPPKLQFCCTIIQLSVKGFQKLLKGGGGQYCTICCSVEYHLQL